MRRYLQNRKAARRTLEWAALVAYRIRTLPTTTLRVP